MLCVYRLWELLPSAHVQGKLILSTGFGEFKDMTFCTMVQLKRRVVTEYFQEQRGFGFDEIFMPVSELPFISLQLAQVLKLEYIIDQTDVKNDFSNAELGEEVSIRQAEGFVCERHPG